MSKRERLAWTLAIIFFVAWISSQIIIWSQDKAIATYREAIKSYASAIEKWENFNRDKSGN